MTRTKKLTRQEAQERLLAAMQVAFDRLSYEGAIDEASLRQEMSEQMARVEKLFGFAAGSFGRGC